MSSPNNPPKKKIMGKKRRKPAEINYPQTGYVRYINENRERIRTLHPSLEAIEITKLVAEEWRKLSEDKRKPYLDAAEIDKERYHRECKNHNDEQDAKKTKVETSSDTEKPKLPPTPPAADTKTPALTNGTKDVPKMLAIPIFTDEFLEHNKQVDTELRNLRKSNTDYEQQNSVLEKHVENMKNGIAKLDMETLALRTANSTLQTYLDKLRKTLATSQLASLSIPSEPNGANLTNIEKYMADLKNMETKNMESNLGPLNKAKDIIRKLDLTTH